AAVRRPPPHQEAAAARDDGVRPLWAGFPFVLPHPLGGALPTDPRPPPRRRVGLPLLRRRLRPPASGPDGLPAQRGPAARRRPRARLGAARRRRRHFLAEGDTALPRLRQARRHPVAA